MLDMVIILAGCVFCRYPNTQGGTETVSLGHPYPLCESWNLLIPLICAGSYATRFSFLMILNMKSAATRQMHISVPHTM